jgi:Flp pilus assembly pilin Flp
LKNRLQKKYLLPTPLKGQSMIEYGLVITLVTLASIGALATSGTTVSQQINNAFTSGGNVVSSGSGSPNLFGNSSGVTSSTNSTSVGINNTIGANGNSLGTTGIDNPQSTPANGGNSDLMTQNGNASNLGVSTLPADIGNNAGFSFTSTPNDSGFIGGTINSNQGSSGNNGGSSAFINNNLNQGSGGTSAGSTASSPKIQNNNFNNTFNTPLQGISVNAFQPSSMLNGNNNGLGINAIETAGNNGGVGQEGDPNKGKIKAAAGL